jgi:pimeloyl-ACP methyl ester carboxylesterase
MEDTELHHRLAAEIAGLDLAEVIAPVRHHVVLREMRFHYLDWGTTGRPPVVFLHRGGETARTWDLKCRALRDSYHCFALDQRGHGDSEWSYTFAYTSEDHAGDVAAFVDHLGLERFVLIGMSMGCLNGLAYAIRHPERLAGFVAVDAGPTVRMAGGEAIVEFRRKTETLDSLDDYVAEACRFNPRRDPRLLKRSLLHNLRRLPDGRWTWKTDQRKREFDFEGMRKRMEALWDEIEVIRCPVLVVRGAESDVFLDEHAERFAEALPDGRWVRIPDSGHTVQGDNPRALVASLREFLATTDRG